jgi:hypothetical protein
MPRTLTPCRPCLGIAVFPTPVSLYYFDGSSLIALGRMMISSSDTQPRLKYFSANPQRNQDYW